VIDKIKREIYKLLQSAGVAGEIELTTPPNPEMGDLSFACFGLAKERGKSPNEIAKELASNVKGQMSNVFDEVQAVGPYVNFFIDPHVLAKQALGDIDESYGQSKVGKKKKYLVEFGCPNPLKVFHLGHLKNLVTGESVARILENAGYKVVRVNYQGDVGMHIAKTMWAIESQRSAFSVQRSASLEKRLKFLGTMYAKGAKSFEENEQAKKEIVAMNKRIYQKDPTLQTMYRLAVKWSLEYFDQIYKRLGAHFDRLYLESEVFASGEMIVRAYLKKRVFKESAGAIIYEGSKHGLHDRVFINSEGFPTYEAKDLGLAQAHFTDYNPDQIIHVVGKEQVEYFKVVFKAIAEIWPARANKEFHLPGGFLQLKDGKMSSRTGTVVRAEDLLNQARTAVLAIMADRDLAKKDEVVEKVAVAAVKYAILKVSVSDDVAFDLKRSVSLEGDSGPYLLYIVARIKSILKKTQKHKNTKTQKHKNTKTQKHKNTKTFTSYEKQLLLQLASFPEITSQAAASLDPSKIAHYLFHLAQTFNAFYHECPVLEAAPAVKEFRLRLIQKVALVMTAGLALLGIETAEEM